MTSAFWHFGSTDHSIPREFEVIEHLVRRAVVAVRHAGEFLHVARVEVADAPLPDLAAFLQALECFHRLGQRNGAAPMQQVKIEPIGLEPREATLAGHHNAFARGVVRINFAHQENLVPAPGQGFRQHFLGTTLAVHLSRVDQPDAEIEPQPDGCDLRRPLRLSLTHVPGAETQHRHLVTALQGYGFHVAAPWLLIRA